MGLANEAPTSNNDSATNPIFFIRFSFLNFN